jgi:hypothetical protein
VRLGCYFCYFARLDPARRGQPRGEWEVRRGDVRLGRYFAILQDLTLRSAQRVFAILQDLTLGSVQCFCYFARLDPAQRA